MSRRFRPSRRLRNEAFSLAIAALVPVALFAVFPRDALRPLPPSPSAPVAASCAFVTLTPEAERKALAAARAAWQLDRGTARHLRIDLFADSLPPMAPRAALGFSATPSATRDAPEPYAPNPLPPTLAAPPPATIAPQPDADAAVPAFSREELLKLN